mmetsp:Transcript_118986/g.333274  ORF Transcript_118986/g.333274 Transcript_118986/m.333274 type:complete len:308 (-) Transcript_118986:291-1214(-)|eukprot:CAMPEP_0176285220 /NCGR_PEP_ID=MMETSP0121_2-20121125/52254_1 /TAXON_ID=160619 /ORGANISM="Kryptoperidinium foliaceum, Strain CCMP 1326" /LENGTH=307 /DNA_ID=CAMNT_0017625691 /DNA_START=8 /DNA_END=931 /DNA_ORIENTATION=-
MAGRCWYLFGCELGDPISAIHLDSAGCSAGSMMGKVWYFGFNSKQPEELAGFSDEGVRGLYLDQDTCYVTYFETCRSWRRDTLDANCSGLNFRSLDRKNTQSVKHILQRGNLVCVLFPYSTLVVDILRQEPHARHFKLNDLGSSADLAPCDFDGDTLAVLDRSNPTRPPILRLVRLESNEQVEADALPKAHCLTMLKLWQDRSVAYAVGATLHLYDYVAKETRHRLTGHGGQIVAIDARDTVAVAVLGSDSVVRIWNGNSGACIRVVEVPDATFYLDYLYSVCVSDARILVSADQGVFLVELEDGEV